jgi:pilus assembly protein CpaE
MLHDIMAFVLDEGSYTTTKAALTARGAAPSSVQQGGLNLLADVLENEAPPKILILDLDEHKDYSEAATRAIGLCGPDCRIIFVGTQNDVALYRKLIHLGGADYIVKPLAADVLNQAILDAGKTDPAQGDKKSEKRGGQIIPIIGARGGLGASFLAVNLAYILAHKLNRHTQLLDLDLHFGTTALALDREPGRGMRAALETPERLDGLLIASSMVQESDKLALLCAEEPLEKPMHFDGNASLALIRPVQADFDFVLVDMPRAMLASQQSLLIDAQQIILVTDRSLAGLRDARRIRTYIKTLKLSTTLQASYLLQLQIGVIIHCISSLRR